MTKYELEKALEQEQKINENLQTELKTAQETIHQLRESNVVEVVRCKDCEHYELMKANNQYFCNEFGGFVHSDDYCSRNSMVGED